MKRRRGSRTLYTVGHSTRTLAELVALLETAGVTRLVDIRSIPRSRTNPQFNRDELPITLPAAGIAYSHLAALGGRRGKVSSVDQQLNGAWEVRAFHNYADYAETAPFAEGLRELVTLCQHETCAIMCAEALWWRCHRRIVTDHMLALGIPVAHLGVRATAEPAVMTPFAVVSKAGTITYPALPDAPVAVTRPRAASPKRPARARPARRSPA